MENITKALLIAGGLLFTILVLTLVIISFNKMSSYYTGQHNTTMVEQITEFNNEFDNYSGQTIRGNELISIINRIVNYNRIYSDMDGAERITITVDLQGHQSDFQYQGTSTTNILFRSSTISNANGNDGDLIRVSELASELSASTGIDDLKLQRLSSDISIICNTKDDEKEERDSKLRQILGYDKNKEFSSTEIQDIRNATLQYYQLTQFKRAMFDCTEVRHSQRDGLINRLSFRAVIENDSIKLN